MTTPTKAPTNWSIERIIAERKRLGIPQDPKDRREWIGFQLRLRDNPKTGKKWNQADVARETFASETSVSIVMLGGRIEGLKGEKIRLLISEVIGVPVPVLFRKESDADA